MNLAHLPSAVGIRNLQPDGRCTGDSHAPVPVPSRSPRCHSPRALPPPAPVRPAEDGGPLAEEPGVHPRGHRTPGRRLPAQRPALPRRLRRRRPGAPPPAPLEGPGQRTRRPPPVLGRLLPGEPPALRPRGPGGHRTPDRRAPGPDPGARLFKKLSTCAGARSGPSRPRPTRKSRRTS